MPDAGSDRLETTADATDGAGDPAPDARLQRGVLSARRALFFALTGLGVAGVLATQGATMAFSSGWSSWLAMITGALVVAPLAVIVGRFSRRHLTTGSLMSYANLEAGRPVGAFVGSALFVGYVSSTVCYTASALVFLVSFLRSVDVEVNRWGHVVVAAVLVASCVWLARRGVSVSVNAAVILGWLGLPLVVVLVAAAAYKSGVDLTPQLALRGFAFGSFAQGAVVAFGIYAGFEGFTALALETADPRRNIPRIVSTVVAVMLAVALAGVFLTVPIMVSNLDALNLGSSPLALLAQAGGLAALGPLADLLMFLSVTGAVLVYLNDAGRIVGTAARDGLLPAGLGYVDPTRKTPARATALMGGLAFTAFGGFVLAANQSLYTTMVCAITLLAYSWFVAYIAIAVIGVRDGLRRRAFRSAAAALAALAGTLGVTAFSVGKSTGAAAALFWAVAVSVPVLWGAALLTRRIRPAAGDETL